MSMEIELYKHQEKGVSYFMEHAGFANFGDMGSGKTLQALTAIKRLNLGMTLIVCPKSLILNWKAEAQKFYPGHFQVLPLQGSKTKKIKAMAKAKELWKKGKNIIVVINYESLISKAVWPLLDEIHWDLICCDESHRIKNGQAKQTKALKKLKRDRAWIMTGTPMPNNCLDIWSQFDFIKPGYFPEWFSVFRRRYAQLNPKVDFPMIVKWLNQDELKAKIARYSYRVMKEECLDLPEKIYKVIPVELSSKTRKVYDEVAKYMFSELCQDADDDGMITVNAMNVLTKMLRLQQITSGFVTTEKLDFETLESCEPEEKDLSTEKLDTLYDLVSDIPGNVIVWCHFKWEVRNIVQRLKGLKRPIYELSGAVDQDQRQKNVEAFQAGKDGIIVCMIQVAGVGLTLTAASNAIYYSRTFNGAESKQSEDRCILHGQKILTPSGLIPIQDIKAGDYVFNRHNQATKVLKTWSRQIRNKVIVEIDCVGLDEPIKVTADHRVLMNNGKWVEAQDLRVGNVVKMPKGKDRKRLKSVIFDPDCKIAKAHDRVRSPEKINLTRDFLFLCGYFAGDGFASIDPKKGKFISLSGNDSTKLAPIKRCIRWIRKNKIKCSVYKPKKSRGNETRAFSSDWAMWFFKNFGHRAKNKRLPAFIFDLNKNQLAEVLKGLVASDGYQRDGRVEYVTVSETLKAHVVWILLQLGHKPCLTRQSCGAFVISWTKGTKQGLKISGLKHYHGHKYNDRVYDLEVENGSSFVVQTAVVHNCHRVGQTKKCVYYDLVCNGTIDEAVLQSLANKQKMADKLTGDDLKRMMYGTKAD